MCAAAAIPSDKIDEVRLKADIVEVVGRRMRLVQKGRDFWGLCPFHGDKDPSLKVDRARGTWHCFGCGEGGSVFNFVMKDQGLSFPEAVKELARLYGVDLPQPRLDPAARRQLEEKERLLHVLQLAGTFFSRELAAPSGSPAREYLLNNRGLDLETVKAFGLGFAPPQWEGLGRFLSAQGVAEELGVRAGLLVSRDKSTGSYDRFRSRVVFPIRDLMGRAISFGGRIIGPGEPKYLNGPESPLFHKSRTLYNLDQARPAMRQKNRVLVVEGYFDVITLAAHGFAETVAPLGTALTAEHVRALKSQAADIVLIMDGDSAGRRAAERALPIFLAEGVSPRVVLLPGGEDPDTYVRAQGAAALAEAVDRARPLMESVLDSLVAAGDLTTPEGKSAVVAAAGEIIKTVGDPITRVGYLERLAGKLALAPEVVAARLGLPYAASGAPR
ncbi:MAG: DNA primase, partial [Pseudomonadota bacterium]